MVYSSCVYAVGHYSIMLYNLTLGFTKEQTYRILKNWVIPSEEELWCAFCFYLYVCEIFVLSTYRPSKYLEEVFRAETAELCQNFIELSLLVRNTAGATADTTTNTPPELRSEPQKRRLSSFCWVLLCFCIMSLLVTSSKMCQHQFMEASFDISTEKVL